jgi:hypothetical protein
MENLQQYLLPPGSIAPQWDPGLFLITGSPLMVETVVVVVVVVVVVLVVVVVVVVVEASVGDFLDSSLPSRLSSPAITRLLDRGSGLPALRRRLSLACS